MKVSFRHQLTIKYSRVIEALSLLCTLGNNTYHSDVLDLSPFDTLKANYLDFFERFSGLPQMRFTWLEFALLSPERDDVSLFINDVRNTSPEQQLVMLLEHEIDENEAVDALLLTQNTNDLIKRLGYDDRFIEIIASLSSVIDQFCEILSAIDMHEAFNDKFSELTKTGAYDAHLEQFKEGTSYRHPLSFAQELMGKPFWNIADYTKYEFIPVYFISPYSMRLMDDKTMILIGALHKEMKSPEALLESVLDPLKSVSDATRLKILRMLYMHPMYGKEIAEALNLTTATVSHHLEALNQQGLVNVEKVKQIKYFSTNYTRLSRSLDAVTRYIKEK